jgi:hypothetical protein
MLIVKIDIRRQDSVQLLGSFDISNSYKYSVIYIYIYIYIYRVFQKELYNFQISNAGALAVAVLGTTIPRA